jgi:hypothetical protein
MRRSPLGARPPAAQREIPMPPQPREREPAGVYDAIQDLRQLGATVIRTGADRHLVDGQHYTSLGVRQVARQAREAWLWLAFLALLRARYWHYPTLASLSGQPVRPLTLE